MDIFFIIYVQNNVLKKKESPFYRAKIEIKNAKKFNLWKYDKKL